MVDTYELFEHALVEGLFWLSAPVELLIMLLETLEVGLPFLTTAVAQLLDPMRSETNKGEAEIRWKLSADSNLCPAACASSRTTPRQAAHGD